MALTDTDDDYDIGEFWRAKKAGRKKRRRKRRCEASGDFEEARRLAADAGLRLMCRSDAHYQLIHMQKRWLINVYPGNQRLWHDPQRGPAPFLRLAENWGLVDVVQAALAAEKVEI